MNIHIFNRQLTPVIKRHIRWSIDKRGILIIYNRITDKTFEIKSQIGIRIWQLLLQPTPVDEIVNILIRETKTSISLDTIKTDLSEFLDTLKKAGLICAETTFTNFKFNAEQKK